MSQDTVLFMSAYKAADIKKHWHLSLRKPTLQCLLNKYHLQYIATDMNAVSESGKWKICTNYDYVRQCTSFHFESQENQGKSQTEETIQLGFYLNLKHAFSLLADSAYFHLEYTFWFKPFWAWIDNVQYQVDAGAFVMNNILIIVFELVNFESQKPLNKDDVGAKIKNYNLLSADKYQFFGDEKANKTTTRIPDLIQKNIADFFWELTGQRYKIDSYGYIHDIVVCSNDIDNIPNYICRLIGVKRPVSTIADISTVDTYEYYPQDGVSVTTGYEAENIKMIIYSVMVLEAIKLYIYLFQVENLEYEGNLRRLVQNHLYLQNLFCSPNVPIQTSNLLKYVRDSESYKMHEEGMQIKITYIKEKNEQEKNKNAMILNVLLYFASFLGAIATLEPLETHLGLPFCVGLGIVILIFSFGLIWLGKAYPTHKKEF